MRLEERTCVECRHVKLCDAMLAVCEDCMRSVWLPALGFDMSPLTAAEETWAREVAAEEGRSPATVLIWATAGWQIVNTGRHWHAVHLVSGTALGPFASWREAEAAAVERDRQVREERER